MDDVFGNLGLLNTERSIVLQTRQGTSIPNSQSPHPPATKQVTDYERLRSQHGANWTQRKPATGTYNCFGLAFASRRTAIYRTGDVELLLKEDGYRRLEITDTPQPGDVLLYIDAEDRSIIHCAVVMEIRRLEGGGVPAGHIPWALSKWNDSYGEDLHHCRHVFFYKDCKWTLEIWTDRP